MWRMVLVDDPMLFLWWRSVQCMYALYICLCISWLINHFTIVISCYIWHNWLCVWWNFVTAALRDSQVCFAQNFWNSWWIPTTKTSHQKWTVKKSSFPNNGYWFIHLAILHTHTPQQLRASHVDPAPKACCTVEGTCVCRTRLHEREQAGYSVSHETACCFSLASLPRRTPCCLMINGQFPTWFILGILRSHMPWHYDHYISKSC